MDSGNIEKRVTRIPEYPMSSLLYTSVFMRILNFLTCHIKHLQKEKGWEFRVVLVEHVGNLLNASQCYNNMSEDSGEIVGLDAQLP
ncbi:UNVERIFIED_CONTAM: hypothetical protein FKN15_055303 [Acipenser sinensis]